MSTKCPLCGKNKSDDELFCPDCSERLNNEYEVEVPASAKGKPNSEKRNSDEVSATTNSVTDKIEESGSQKEEQSNTTPERSTEQPKVEVRKKVVDAPNFDKRAWKKRRDDKRSDSNKSYYELSKERRGNKFLTVLFSIIVLVLVTAVGLYLYNNNVRSSNIERSAWDIAKRENTVDSYLTYMDEFPSGKFYDTAYKNMLELKTIEAEVFESLKTSENTSEFTDFLSKYPQSPFERIVKSRLDSLMWQSTLKENAVDAYKEYIRKSNSEEILGNYIGEAQKRFDMLDQDTPIDKEEFELLKQAVDGFFVGLSTMSKEKLGEHVEAVIQRYNNVTDLSSDELLNQLLNQALDAKATSVKFDAEVAKLKYKKIGVDNYEVNIPVQKLFEDDGGGVNRISGYIVHLKLLSSFKVYSFYETKPYNEAP